MSHSQETTENLKTIKKDAKAFINAKMSHMSTSDRVAASREGKRLILALNEIYKIKDDKAIMDLMKEITVKKKKIEVRL
jgi:hypothetical protein